MESDGSKMIILKFNITYYVCIHKDLWNIYKIILHIISQNKHIFQNILKFSFCTTEKKYNHDDDDGRRSIAVAVHGSMQYDSAQQAQKTWLSNIIHFRFVFLLLFLSTSLAFWLGIYEVMFGM